mmetsp:Transcript_12502/g.48039  ORF Transcript_12502/g.48039 Transcript_12502/m.48039 type:complete len:201 (-) Transcript_12502:1309-1911(-)
MSPTTSAGWVTCTVGRSSFSAALPPWTSISPRRRESTEAGRSRCDGRSYCSRLGRSGRPSARSLQPSQPGACLRGWRMITGSEARPACPSSALKRVGSPNTLCETTKSEPSGSRRVSSVQFWGNRACTDGPTWIQRVVVKLKIHRSFMRVLDPYPPNRRNAESLAMRMAESRRAEGREPPSGSTGAHSPEETLKRHRSSR